VRRKRKKNINIGAVSPETLSLSSAILQFLCFDQVHNPLALGFVSRARQAVAQKLQIFDVDEAFR